MTLLLLLRTPASSGGGGDPNPNPGNGTGAGNALSRRGIFISPRFFDGQSAYPVSFNNVNANTDYTLWDTAAGKIAYLVGFTCLLNTAANVKLKSDANVLADLSLNNNPLLLPFDPAKPSIIVSTNAGEKLIFRSDAVLGYTQAYIIEK